jgi:flagellar biosynthesis component FlhA
VLARILRALLREDMVLRDLRAILESLVLYENPASAGLEQCVAYLRSQLSRHGTFALAASYSIPVREFLVDITGAPGSMAEADIEALRDRVWAQIIAHPNTVVVASREQRALIRALLQDELPDVPVISTGELPAFTPIAVPAGSA